MLLCLIMTIITYLLDNVKRYSVLLYIFLESQIYIIKIYTFGYLYLFSVLSSIKEYLVIDGAEASNRILKQTYL